MKKWSGESEGIGENLRIWKINRVREIEGNWMLVGNWEKGVGEDKGVGEIEGVRENLKLGILMLRIGKD